LPEKRARDEGINFFAAASVTKKTFDKFDWYQIDGTAEQLDMTLTQESDVTIRRRRVDERSQGLTLMPEPTSENCLKVSRCLAKGRNTNSCK
jgi:hypothetical protein